MVFLFKLFLVKDGLFNFPVHPVHPVLQSVWSYDQCFVPHRTFRVSFTVTKLSPALLSDTGPLSTHLDAAATLPEKLLDYSPHIHQG